MDSPQVKQLKLNSSSPAPLPPYSFPSFSFFGCVNTPWIIYTPTATGVTNAKKEGRIWGQNEGRRTATNKALKGEGNRTPPCWGLLAFYITWGVTLQHMSSCTLTELATTTTLHDDMFQVTLCDWIFIWMRIWPCVQISSHTIQVKGSLSFYWHSNILYNQWPGYVGCAGSALRNKLDS